MAVALGGTGRMTRGAGRCAANPAAPATKTTPNFRAPGRGGQRQTSLLPGLRTQRPH